MGKGRRTQTTRLLYRFPTYCFEIPYILLLPGAAWSLYQFSTFNNNIGIIDAWVYFGYIHNFQDLIERYGLPYYSVRYGLIFPLLALVKVLGPVTGYIVFVYLLYLLAGVPLYLLFRARFSVHAAILAYAILVSSVWFARAVLWTYPDASAVSYLIAATALIFLEPKHRRLGGFAVGLLIGLAINSNIFALAIGTFAGIAYSIYFRSGLWARLRQDAPYFAGGLVVIQIAGMVGYYICCNQANFLRSTFSAVQWSTRGSGQAYQVSYADLMQLNYLYLIPFLLVSMLFLLREPDFRIRSMCYAVVSYLSAVAIFFFSFRFASHAALLEYFYYFSYFLIPCVFCLPLIPVILARTSDSETRVLNVALGSFLFPPLVVTYGSPDILETLPTNLVTLAAVFSLLLVLLAIRKGKLADLAVMLFAMSVHMLFLSTMSKSSTSLEERLHVYARMYGVGGEVGMTRYRLGLKFIQTMPYYREDNRPIYFWYSNADNLAHSLQSTYLWGYSRLMDAKEGTRGLPFLKGVNVELLHQRSSLVLFDRENRIVNRGIEELRGLGVRFAVNKTRKICETDICYTIAVLDVRGGSGHLEREWKKGGYRPLNFDMSWSRSGTDAKIGRSATISIATPAKAWSYAAVASIVFSERPPTGRGLVRIVFLVNGANAGIGFLASDERKFLKRVEIHPADEPQELFLEFDRINELRQFVIQAWNHDKSAKVQILEIEVRG